MQEKSFCVFQSENEPTKAKQVPPPPPNTEYRFSVTSTEGVLPLPEIFIPLRRLLFWECCPKRIGIIGLHLLHPHLRKEWKGRTSVTSLFISRGLAFNNMKCGHGLIEPIEWHYYLSKAAFQSHSMPRTMPCQSPSSSYSIWTLSRCGPGSIGSIVSW